MKGAMLAISVLQACCTVITEYGIPSDFVRKSTELLQIKISTAQLNLSNGAIQVLRNADGGGRVSDFPEKSITRTCTVQHYLRYKEVGGCQFLLEKKHYVTLE